MTTFVSVGNGTQPFNRLIAGVVQIAHTLPQPVIIQYGNSPLTEIGNFVAKSFVEMGEFATFVAKAELLIMHGGAGSLIHAVQAGKLPVVMPRRAKYGEIVDDHQLEFVRALSKAGKVVIAEEPENLLVAVEVAMSRQGAKQQIGSEARVVGMISDELRRHAQRLRRNSV